MSQTDVLIKSLTPEQEAKKPAYIAKWTEIGLRPGPADMEKAKEFISQAYRVANLPPPVQWLHARGPEEGARMAAEVAGNGAEPSSQLSNCGYGNHDVGWLSFFAFFLYECGLEKCRELEPLMKLTEVCGWWWPFEQTCIISDRSLETPYRDEQGRLHREGGPAIEYGDGHKVWAFHGTRIPQQMGEVKIVDWSPDWILTETNTELKRILIQTIGYGRILQHFPHTVIDVLAREGGDYELVRLDKEIDVAPIVMLKVVCPSTGAIYVHRVEPSMTNCEEARSSMWGEKNIVWLKET